MPLDIAVGILCSLVLAHAFGLRASLSLILFGVGSALLPDIDVLPVFRRVTYDHRSSFHWPLVYVPVAAMLLALDPLYGELFLLAICAHFIHDTVGIGWGVAWFAPFSLRKFLFPERDRRREYGWLMTWLPEEEGAMAAKYHDPHWLRTWYARPTLLAFIEYGALVCSIIALAAYYVHL